MDETIRLEAADGTWEVGGVDRRRGIWAEDLQCTWDDWGPRTAHWTMKRDPGAPQPDLSGFTPVIIEKGRGVWEGYIDQTPAGEGTSLSVEAIGWPDHGDEDLSQRMFIHSRLPDWKDSRSLLATVLSTWLQSGSVEVGTGAIRIGWAQNAFAAALQHVGVTLDLGEGSLAKHVAFGTEKNSPSAALTFLIRGHNIPNPNPAAGQYEDAFISLHSALADGDHEFTFTNPWRYITILMYRNDGVSGVTGGEHMVRLPYVRVFADAAYETGFASNLTADVVLKYLLPRLCPLWSQDLSGIDPTLFTFGDLAPTEPRNFREHLDVLNAVHGYMRKLERGRRFVFGPQPLNPLVCAPATHGVSFVNSSKNATRDIYNRATGSGTGPDGEPVTVERRAAQMPGVPLRAISTPAPDNPTFLTNTTSWTAALGGTITRDTAVFDTSPASGRWDNPQIGATLTETFTGTFKRGQMYVLTLRSRSSISGKFQNWFTVDFGNLAGGDFASASTIFAFNVFGDTKIAWVPTADTGGVTFRLTRPYSAAAGSFYIDSLRLEVASPTLADRRGRTRTKAISMPTQAVDVAVIERLLDIWLKTHMRTPATGDLAVDERALKHYLTGEGMHPFELGEYAGQLVCLLTEIDPDTGHLGRDVPIAQVSYDGNTESSRIALDSVREDFDKLVARYDLFMGGGATPPSAGGSSD